mmetsp:Transcript_87659/g.200286  ORF Transcript_87659/g.200286 Transcript_87659/m.200286 type:complete len:210 (+) Transcript_87659:106-735(+)
MWQLGRSRSSSAQRSARRRSWTSPSPSWIFPRMQPRPCLKARRRLSPPFRRQLWVGYRMWLPRPAPRCWRTRRLRLCCWWSNGWKSRLGSCRKPPRSCSSARSIPASAPGTTPRSTSPASATRPCGPQRPPGCRPRLTSSTWTRGTWRRSRATTWTGGTPGATPTCWWGTSGSGRFCGWCAGSGSVPGRRGRFILTGCPCRRRSRSPAP